MNDKPTKPIIKVVKKADAPNESSILYTAWRQTVSAASELARLLHIKTCKECGRKV